MGQKGVSKSLSLLSGFVVLCFSGIKFGGYSILFIIVVSRFVMILESLLAIILHTCV